MKKLKTLIEVKKIIAHAYELADSLDLLCFYTCFQVQEGYFLIIAPDTFRHVLRSQYLISYEDFDSWFPVEQDEFLRIFDYRTMEGAHA